MTLRCVSPYSAVWQGERIAINPGEVIASPELAAFVRADSPDSFEDAALHGPMAHRAVLPGDRERRRQEQHNTGAMGVADHPGLRRG